MQHGVEDERDTVNPTKQKTYKNYLTAGLRSPIAIYYEKAEIEKFFNNQTMCICRVCIVDKDDKIIYDKLVKPLQVVTNFRTNITGVSKDDLLNGEDFYTARLNVLEITNSRILIGYRLLEFLSLMKIRHPIHLLRDISYFRHCALISTNDTLDIKFLAKQFLKMDLKYENNTQEKAITTMKLYKQFQKSWEIYESDKNHITNIAYALDCAAVHCVNENNKRVYVAARVSIVDYNCAVVYDRLFKPEYNITDYRNNITGLFKKNFTHAEHLRYSINKIKSIIKGNILVGHELSHHLKLLGLQQSFSLRRDSSSFRPFLLILRDKPTPTLKDLAQVLLNITLQDNTNTVENARTAMKLYIKFKHEWDAEIRSMVQEYYTHIKIQRKRRKSSPLAINYGRVLAYYMDRKQKLIARVTIVDENKKCIYDVFVQPNMISTVADCYTKTTGITLEDLKNGTSKKIVRQELMNLLEDRIVIGYNLNYFFTFFRINLDLWNKRDISLYPDFFGPLNSLQTIYKITMQFLKVRMYRNSSSITRASIFMDLYSKYKEDWDISVAQMVTDMKNNALNKINLPGGPEHIIGDPISMQCSLVVENQWGYMGHNIIGRLVLVDKEGKCVYDKYIKPNPNRPIIDYRTNITGIRATHLASGSQYYTVVSEVTRIIQNKIIIGEQLLKCIRLLPHKAIDIKLIRDINQFSIFKKDYLGFYSLAKICIKYLGFVLRDETDAVERAQAIMLIYRKYAEIWEFESQKRNNKIEKRNLKTRVITYKPTPWYSRTKINTLLT